MVSPGDKEFLEDKKRKFLSVVKRSADYLDYPTPKVKFWKSYDSSHFEDERAHIHIESNTICIAETELRSMTYEDIEETASHEVSHLRDLSHGARFQDIQIRTQANLWKPPTGEGIVSIEGKERTTIIKKEPKKKERPIKSRCNYHICGKKAKTTRCPYCEKYFCEEHIKPREPDLSSPFTYQQKDTHPCFAYSRYLTEKKIMQNEKYAKKLDEMFGSRRKRGATERVINRKIEKEYEPVRTMYLKWLFTRRYLYGIALLIFASYLMAYGTNIIRDEPGFTMGLLAGALIQSAILVSIIYGIIKLFKLVGRRTEFVWN